MLDLNPLFEFSRANCVALCTFLVPFNLLTTLTTLVFLGFNQTRPKVWQSAGWAIAGSTIMALHVVTWLMIGVIRLQTFILFSLALCCLILNLWAVLHPQSFSALIHRLVAGAKNLIGYSSEKRANV